MKQCIRNVVTVLENDPKFKGAIRYNMMTDRNDIVKGLGWYRESPALTDSDIDHIMLYLEEHYSLTTEKKIKSAINVVAMENKYHPIREKLVDQIINNWLHFTKRLLVKFHRAYKSNDRLLDLHLLHQNIYKFCLQVPALY